MTTTRIRCIASLLAIGIMATAAVASAQQPPAPASASVAAPAAPPPEAQPDALPSPAVAEKTDSPTPSGASWEPPPPYVPGRLTQPPRLEDRPAELRVRSPTLMIAGASAISTGTLFGIISIPVFLGSGEEGSSTPTCFLGRCASAEDEGSDSNIVAGVVLATFGGLSFIAGVVCLTQDNPREFHPGTATWHPLRPTTLSF